RMAGGVHSLRDYRRRVDSALGDHCSTAVSQGLAGAVEDRMAEPVRAPYLGARVQLWADGDFVGANSSVWRAVSRAQAARVPGRDRPHLLDPDVHLGARLLRRRVGGRSI